MFIRTLENRLRFIARSLWLILGISLLSGCLGYPDNVTPVSDYDVKRYMGKWYEIARLDHSFERGLDQVTAEYSLRDDGGVDVMNRGYLSSEARWKDASGKAYFVDSEDDGYLKVSFFGPFYSSYVIFELDAENYQYAFVSGPDTSYLWLLARTPQIDPSLMDHFVASAGRLGFDTSKLILPEQK